jgi:3D (Asp-Asp-Asp) domain-containing protein
VIQSGDTLSQIAVAFGLGTDGVTVLMDENRIQDAKLIRSGQTLRIPLPPLQERITVPLGGKNRLTPEDIATFFGESVGAGISRGLVFRILQENTIVSCLPGRVIDVGASYVVVYHGNGLKAVYNQLNKLYVKKGDWVMSGQAIGVSAPPEFRLEVMIDFEYRDPMLLFLQNMGNFQLTFYTEWDDGNLPFFPYFRRTKEGGFAREWYTVAADPALISPGTMVYVPHLRSTPSRGLFVVEDTGSAIKNRKLDIYIRDIQEASKMKVTTEVYCFRQ